MKALRRPLTAEQEASIRELIREIDEAESYTIDEIVPIPAICTGRLRHEWVPGGPNGPIRAPSLRGCLCGWCGKTLKPHPDWPPVEDAETKRKRQRSLQPRQLRLEATR